MFWYSNLICIKLLFICIIGISHYVYCDYVDLASRGKNKENTDEVEPEFHEETLTSFGLDGEPNQRSQRQINVTQGYRDITKRGIVEVIRQWTVYKENGKPYVDNIQNLCMKGHNFFRSQHQKTMPVKYDNTLARHAEEYAKLLARTNTFRHDPKIPGQEGENLYRMDNTYNLKASPVHGMIAWYEESWEPLKGPKRNYDYNWEPRNVQDFQNRGVGHFTQFIWKATAAIGCGVASTTYTSGGRKWTRTVMATRYTKFGNLIGVFKKNVFPLTKPNKVSKNGKTLEGFRRGKLYTVRCTNPPKKGKTCMKWKDKSDCVNTVHPKECAKWKGYKWCSREWAKRDCHCTCG